MIIFDTFYRPNYIPRYFCEYIWCNELQHYIYIYNNNNKKNSISSSNSNIDNNLKAIMFQLIKQNYNKKMQLHIFLWRE